MDTGWTQRNHIQSNKYLPIPHCSCCFWFVGIKILGCEGSSRETDKSLLVSITSSQRFSSHAQVLFQCLQLCLWHCVTARLQLRRERSFSHVCQLCSMVIWAIYPCHSLSHPGGGCILASPVAVVPDPHTEFLFFQLSIPNYYRVIRQLPS